MRNTIILLSFLLWVGLLNSNAQNDPLYNQYQFNQLLINPAYAGVNDRMTATWLTRVQWLGIDGAPVTNSASVHTTINATNMALGMMILNDRLGINNNNEVNVMYSYRLNFGETKLQFGLQGGMINFNYDYSKLTLEYLDDPLLTAQQSKFTKPNIGSGIFYYGSNFFVGFSVPRMIDVKVNDGLVGSVRYRRSEYLSAGYIFMVSEGFKLKPSVLLKYVNGAPFSYDLNMNALLSEVFWVGLTLRNQNALGLNTQVQINNKMRFGYTYEYAFKPMSFGSYGTHELMLSIDFTPFRNQFLTRRYF
jgi:type IX secretion system PorP/SprF family membrane protein